MTSAGGSSLQTVDLVRVEVLCCDAHDDGMWITLHLLLSLDWLSERADKQRHTHALPRAERTHDMEGQQMGASGEGSQRMSITNKPKEVKGPSEKHR
jgi:hypothetical protein